MDWTEVPGDPGGSAITTGGFNISYTTISPGCEEALGSAIFSECGDTYSNRFVIDNTDGITSDYATNAIYSKVDDVNYGENSQVGVNLATLSDSDEGWSGSRQQIKFAASMTGTILTNSGGSEPLLTMTCLTNCPDMSNRIPLIDTTFGEQSGSVTNGSAVGIPAPAGQSGGEVITLNTTGLTYTASAMGFLPAQANIEGLVYVTSNTSGVAGTAVTVQYINGSAVTDANAVTCGGSVGNCATGVSDVVVVNINSSATSAIRTQADIISLFAGGAINTLDGGALVVFPASGTVTSTPATVQAATALNIIGATRQPNRAPESVTFAVNAASPPTTSGLLDIVDHSLPEVTIPSAVSLVSGNIYSVTAPLYFLHNPAVTCQGGAVGTFLEETNYTALSGSRYVQTIQCSPTTGTLWMGDPSSGTVIFQGTGGPANLYLGSVAMNLVNPSWIGRSAAFQLIGQYAQIMPAPAGAFAIGDNVEDVHHVSQKYVDHNRLESIVDPFASWNGYREIYNGTGLSNGQIWNETNNTPADSYTAFADGTFPITVGPPRVFDFTGVWGRFADFAVMPSSFFSEPSPWPDAYTLVPYFGTVVNGINAMNQVAPVTACAVTSNILTLTGTFPVGLGPTVFAPGQNADFSNFTGGCSFLNNTTSTISTVSSTTLTASFVTANLATTADVGKAYTRGIILGTKQTESGSDSGSVDLYTRNLFAVDANIGNGLVCTTNNGRCVVQLTGTTGTITGTSLTAGSCDSGTVTVAGATVGHTVGVSSTTGADVGGSFNLRASVTATNTITVNVCSVVAGTPPSLAYNVTSY
jgi:hypothetical protein